MGVRLLSVACETQGLEEAQEGASGEIRRNTFVSPSKRTVLLIPLKDHNRAQSIPFITISLILGNIGVFCYQLWLGEGAAAFIYRAGATPYEIVHMTDINPVSPFPLPLTLLTSLFIHGGIAHLLGNLLYLWIFGNNVEDYFGHLTFLGFYVACGLAASLTHILTHSQSTVPMIGASGAIAGTLGAYLILYPGAQVSTLVFLLIFVRIIRIPAVVILTLWFMLQILNSESGGGVAWYAHIGGFIAGMFLVSLIPRKRRRKRVSGGRYWI